VARELNFRGLDLVRAINRLLPGFSTVAVNLRSYIKGGFTLRNPLSAELIASLPAPIHTVRRLNDSTPNGPASGYALIIGAGTNLYCWNSTIGLVLVATGLSGNPLSMVAFRPNASVQPWMYVADSAEAGAVTLITKYLISGDAVNFPSSGMLKVNSNAVCWKMGVKEPQTAPVVSTANSSVAFGGTGALLATAIPWTNYLSQNSGFNYGETEGPPNVTPPVDGTPPFIVDCENATSISITALALNGTVVISGTTNPTLTAQSSGRVTPGSPGWPGQFIQVEGSSSPPSTASYIIGCFTDGAGNVIPAGVAPLFISNIVDVGLAFSTATPIPVPYGAVAFQIGINSEGNTFTQGSPPNSGNITLEGTVTTNALPAVLSILGTLNLSYWGDSPSSGPVAEYIWKNSGDPSGSGPVRSATAANGSTTGNSFIFDATFTAGIPGLPGVGTDAVSMAWTTLNPDSVATGSAPVFPAPLTTTYPNQTIYANFNFAVAGNLYVPAAGNYTFVLTSMDDCIWGIGGGAKVVSVSSTGPGGDGSNSLAQSGQTLTALNGYPLLPRGNVRSGEGGDYVQSTVVVNFPAAGIYPIELDFDYWYHSGRILLLEASPMPLASPTIIPPLPASVRQETQYRYVYRSSATGATSNPSPESAPETIPVVANTVTSVWSNDPQVDVVDYYRIDSTTADFTYVATGPNDNAGSGTNTPISDSLTDTELGTQLLSYDNYEPFPSIDLPQKGICSISGGVITFVSNDPQFPQSAAGFNLRWLAGTEILIGSPTSLAYTFIARPTSTASVTIPEVPDGTDVAYEIPEPILANQPMPYLWGPSDNIPFASACGDTLRQGTMYWCAGNNLDAAPDTNQQDLTDPSEALVNGCYAGGKGFVGTIKRVIAVVPNFFNSLSTATGTTGSTWSVRTTVVDRGLFIPRCLTVEGSGKIFFRVDDGIHYSPNGGASQSITDQTLYPIFPHEGSTPVPVVRNGVTIYPPDDTQPQLQKFSNQNGYMYWDYQGMDGNPHTLAFDIAAMAWIWDSYIPAVTIHAGDEGESVQGCLVGCSDGTMRTFSSSGTETVMGTIVSAAIGGRGWNHAYEMTMEYSAQATATLSFIAADEGNGSYAPASVTLPSTGGAPTKYTFPLGPNKWKWLQIELQSSDPDADFYLEGTAIAIKSWGIEDSYQLVNPFASSGGEGGQA
jgi:hypothetical protein